MPYTMTLAIRAPGTQGDPARQMTEADVTVLRARILTGLATVGGSIRAVSRPNAESAEVLMDAPAVTVAQAKQFVRFVFAGTAWIASFRMHRNDREDIVFFEGALRAAFLMFRELPEPPQWTTTTEARP